MYIAMKANEEGQQNMSLIDRETMKGVEQTATSVAHETKKVDQQNMTSAPSKVVASQADDAASGSSSLLPSSGTASNLIKMPASAASNFIPGFAKDVAWYVPGTESYKKLNSSNKWSSFPYGCFTKVKGKL